MAAATAKKKKRQARIIKDPNDGLTIPMFEAPDTYKSGKVGRPSKYTFARQQKIKYCCKRHAYPSYNFIASYVGVAISTFHSWLNSVIGLRESIDHWRARGMADLREKSYLMALHGNTRMLKLLLQSRDDDFRPQLEISGDIQANWSLDTPPPELL